MPLISIPRGYADQYRQNLRLAAPVVLSQLGQVVVQLADNLMVGRLGAAPLAGVSFAGSVFFLFFITGMGLTLGLTPLVGEMYAKGRHRVSATYFQHSLTLYTFTGVLLLGLMLALAPLLSRMGQDPEVVLHGAGYYKYLAWSIVPFMLFAAFKQFMEGLGNTKVVMAIVLGANLLNIFLNWVFIYGKLGAPQMGAAGAGLSTLIARIGMPVAIFIYFWGKDSFRRYFRLFSVAGNRLMHYLSLVKVGWPIASQMLMEATAFSMTSVMMGWIGAVELAGNQIALSMASSAFMVVIGIATATTIRVSHEFGRGNLREMRRAANASYHMGLVWNTFTALVFIALRNYIPLAFTSDPKVVEAAASLLICAALFQLPDGLQMISLGILRGLQDVKITMKVAFVSYILVNLPVAYLCAFVLKMGPAGLWTGFIFGLMVAAWLLNRRFRTLYRRLREEAR